jgi:hypothetical protein
MQTGATFDSTENYRYLLWRKWDEALPTVGFVMLNPSRADAELNDPTIRRCIGFARSWGFGGLEVVNLFAYRAVTPKLLNAVADPIGNENDQYLKSLPERVDRIILAWGNWGRLYGRDREVLSLLASITPLHCLGITQLGQPKHPLYLEKTILPVLLPSANRDLSPMIS